MCGVCGMLRIGDGPDPDPGLMDRMTDTLAHRGPSDRGTWHDGPVALGNRRLAVIDLSSAGHMPMGSEDGAVQITYNGEVYNFRELKQSHGLAEKYPFRSQTDTEVLLHLYREMGLDMVRELNGMFAIAIWDGREGRLHLARDRYGIKPLFWQQDDTYFRFGSEIKAILEDPRVERRPSLQALHDFLSFDYVPGPQSAFEGIHELAPGHVLTVDGDGAGEPQRYWDLRFDVDGSIDEATAVRRARELMETSVRRRLIADVPVGVMLSGGMDSSTIVGLMARETREPVHTYAVRFRDGSFDEGTYARIVSDHFGTVHREVVITSERVREMLPSYLRYIDEPYGDGSAVPTYYVCSIAKDEVVVVLSGEGGDEVFAGYDTHEAFRVARLARRVPKWIRQGIVAPLVNLLPVSDKKLSLEFKLKRFLGGVDLDPVKAHLWWRIVLTEAQKLALYSPAVLERFAPEPSVRHFTEAAERSAVDDVLSRLLHVDSTVFLPDDLMIKNDRMSMAHSLEARVPFTDPELTGFMATVPSSVKLPGRRKKHVMKLATADLLPRAILERKKIGLEMPYSRWLRGEFTDLVDRYLDAGRVEATGLFRPEAVRRLVDEHRERRVDHGRALWGLLNYMMWFELYLGG